MTLLDDDVNNIFIYICLLVTFIGAYAHLYTHTYIYIYIYMVLALDCPNLVPPVNGAFSFITNGNLSGSRVLYSCDRGYRVAGVELGTIGLRVCQVNGTWTGEEFTCEGTKEEQLSPLKNILLTIPSNKIQYI